MGYGVRRPGAPSTSTHSHGARCRPSPDEGESRPIGPTGPASGARCPAQSGFPGHGAPLGEWSGPAQVNLWAPLLLLLLTWAGRRRRSPRCDDHSEPTPDADRTSVVSG